MGHLGSVTIAVMEKVRQWLTRFAFSIILAAAVYLLVGKRLFPLPSAAFSTNPRVLPYYSLLSLYRMTVAYALALAFSLAYGSAAALRKSAAKVLLPILDVLQSIPVLGFFPAAIFLFVTLVGRGRLGVELAAIFLVFTSQAWNMTFGVYESLTTVPKDIREAGRLLRLSGSVAARRLYLPTAVPRLVHNSILSWAGGWYFLVASEIIAAGPVRYRLPGIGSYLIVASERGEYGNMAAGLGVLLAIVIAMDLALWRPLTVWAEKFKYELAAGSVSARHSWLLGLFHRFRTDPLVEPAWRLTGKVLFWPFRISARLGAGVAGRYRASQVLQRLAAAFSRLMLLLAALGLLALVSYAGIALAGVVTKPMPAAAFTIPAALLASFLRLLAAYVICLAWTVPVATIVGGSKRLSKSLMPVFEIAASVPATALFPLIVVLVVAYTGSMNLAAVLLVLTGMQWYLLFNLISGIAAIPEDFHEVAASLRLSPWLKWKRLVMPAAFPALITGSVTAWGGGWNALIIAEYFRFGGRTLSAFGIGSLLDEATYVTGDSRMILYSLVAMVLVIVSLNRLVWRQLYDFAAKRYRVEY